MLPQRAQPLHHVAAASEHVVQLAVDGVELVVWAPVFRKRLVYSCRGRRHVPDRVRHAIVSAGSCARGNSAEHRCTKGGRLWAAGDLETARRVRQAFLPLEDLRDAWGAARVLHEAVALAGIVETGPIIPFLSGLDDRQRAALRPIARALSEASAALHG